MIPHYQPIPLPAPFWFLESFLVLGFFLHLVPMNIVLGGTFSSAILLLLPTKGQSYTKRFAKELAKSLPVFLSFAITQGIVPLLFLQLLYGPLYYTSSIIMALPWLAVILILLVAYYSLYLFKYQEEKIGKISVAFLILSGILFLAIAYIFVNNMTLMLNPSKWTSLIDISSTGFHMNHGEPQILPRFSIMFFNAFAITGMAMGCFGLYHYKKDQTYGSWLIKSGSILYVVASIGEIIPMIMLVKVLPESLVAKFSGGDLLSYICSIGLLSLSALAIILSVINFQKPRCIIFSIALSCVLLANACMVIARHLIRVHFTSSYIQPQNLPVNIQVDLLTVFLALFVGLLVYLAWLISIALKAYRKDGSI